MDYLKLFETEQDYNAYITDDPLLPNVSYVIESDVVHYNPKEEDEDTYLTFEALEDGTFSFTRDGLSYSTDEGQTWTALAANTQTPTVLSGETIMFKGEMTPTSEHGIGTFRSTGRFNIRGNVMSLLFGDDYEGQDDLTGYDYAFRDLFNGAPIVDASRLLLPAATLASFCYVQMFYQCYYLTTPPTILPATTLASACYMGMFYSCTNLTTTPALPAETLVQTCYEGMFMFCPILNYIKMMATDITAERCLYKWVQGVSSTGTFVKNANAQWDVTGESGVPSGWTIETE